MKAIILATLFALWALPASAHFDDRYFDSRAAAVPAKAKIYKHARHRTGYRHIASHKAARAQRIARAGYKTKHRRAHWRANMAERPAALPRSYEGRVGNQVIGGRPAGCPSRFCGCGASIEVFGRIIPALNLAANWLRFPRTSPAPGMVAARRGHVFVLKQHIAGNTWLVHDSNSGGRKTRIHPRSLAGFTVVNPRG